MAGGVLVHEWLSATGGSENVFDVLVDTFPDADLLCLWSDVRDRYPGRLLQQTWLASTPLRRHKMAAVPFLPSTWRRRPGTYDWALVSTHMFAHHVSFRHQPRHFRKYAYIHSPARYVWEPELDRRGSSRGARAASSVLRPIDRGRAAEIDVAMANSEFVRQRVQRAWHIDAQVIYPPVEVAAIQRRSDWSEVLSTTERRALDSLPSEFLLGASRLIPYKSLDLVLSTGSASGLPVVIAGDGPERARLEALADRDGVRSVFLGRVSDELLYALYQRCVAYVFPAVEDFGIMPVEAMAAGASVICGRVGGVTETVSDLRSGAHVDFRDPDELRRAVDWCGRNARETPARAAQRFDRENFVAAIREAVTEL